MLSSAENERYARQMGPGVLTEEGQLRLKNSTALISRVGGMGGPASLMLTTGGVGNVIIAHGGDMISPDLNRQILGSEAVIGSQRAPHFGAYLETMNQFANVEALAREPNDEEADRLAARCDIILSCPPTFEERLRLNRAAMKARIPFVDAAQWGMTGTLFVVKPGETACLECIYPEPPPFEEFFPVVGAISCAVGALAALEAIKILSDCGQPMWGKMYNYDGFNGRSHWLRMQRRADCPACKVAQQ